MQMENHCFSQFIVSLVWFSMFFFGKCSIWAIWRNANQLSFWDREHLRRWQMEGILQHFNLIFGKCVPWFKILIDSWICGICLPESRGNVREIGGFVQRGMVLEVFRMNDSAKTRSCVLICFNVIVHLESEIRVRLELFAFRCFTLTHAHCRFCEKNTATNLWSSFREMFPSYRVCCLRRKNPLDIGVPGIEVWLNHNNSHQFTTLKPLWDDSPKASYRKSQGRDRLD